MLAERLLPLPNLEHVTSTSTGASPLAFRRQGSYTVFVFVGLLLVWCAATPMQHASSRQPERAKGMSEAKQFFPVTIAGAEVEHAGSTKLLTHHQLVLRTMTAFNCANPCTCC